MNPFTSARFGPSSSAALPEDDGFSMSSAPHLAHIVFTHIIRASVQLHDLFNGSRKPPHEPVSHIHTVNLKGGGTFDLQEAGLRSATQRSSTRLH